MEPIMEFKDEAQAYECLKEWQTRLFLDDWIIKLELLEKNDDEDFGEVEYNSTTLKATIRLYQEPVVCEIKQCAEKTLVHELLHCYMHISQHLDEDSADTIQNYFFGMHAHRKVEKLAQSFIMAKYNIPFSWFKNF